MTARPRPVLGDGLLLAAGTLVAVPVPPPRAVGAQVARAAMLLAPLVAVVPAGAALGVCLAARALGLGPLVTAVLVVGALALLTRGLHLDGLADTADGLASGYDRDRALEVMHRGDTGPAGAAALVLVLLLQVAALAQCLTGTTGSAGAAIGAAAVVVAVVAGRAVLPVACARGVPAGRGSGLGAAVAGTVPRTAAAGVVVGVGALAGVGTAATGSGWWPGPVAVLVAVVVAGLLLHRCVRRFGGITGDVLGACIEVATAAALVTLAAVRG